MKSNPASVASVIFSALCCVGFFSAPVHAEVFWSFPLSSGRGENIVAGMPGVSSSQPLFRERAVYNGVGAELFVWTSVASLPEVTDFFRRMFPDALISGSGKLITIKAGKKGQFPLTRVLCSGGAFGGVTVFVLQLSGKPAAGQVKWPGELPPLAVGEKAGSVIEFPGRRAVFASVSSAGGAAEPELRLRQTAAYLRGRGWMPAGHEDSVSIGGSGDIYVSSSPRRIMLVSYDQAGNGIYYLRKENK